MRIPVVSLFCGCGGLDLGFAEAGFDTVLALDINPAAVETYNYNHGKGIARTANLAEVDGHAIIAMIEQQGIESPRGVIGGAPCQTFSEGNRYVKSDDIRHTLPEKFAAMLKVLNQQYNLDFFVFENVKGITYTKHRETFSRFKGLFEDAGFVLEEGLLDAQFFGVPQKRPRVFVVGFNRRRYGSDSPFQFPLPGNGDPPIVASAIRNLPEPLFFRRGTKPENVPYHPNHWTMQPRSIKFKGGNLREGQSIGRSFRVLAWNRPSWTVAYGHREIHIHPTGTRRLSIFEAMLLQGFPMRYRLRGHFSEQVAQVSDAVPPPLARALAESVHEYLIGNEHGRSSHVQWRLVYGENNQPFTGEITGEGGSRAAVAG